MVKFIRDDNQEFLMDAKYKVLTIEGLGTTTQEIFTEKKAIGDGDIITGRRLNSRSVIITAGAKDGDLNDVTRLALGDFFNPKHSFRCYVTYKSNSVWFYCQIDTVEIPTDTVYMPQQLILTLYCADPYLRSVDNFGQDIAGISPMMGFPLLISEEKGFVTSVRNFSKKVFIKNDGVIDTYFKAVIHFNANTQNFKLIKNDEEIMCVTGSFVAGDELIIDFESKTVTINEENAINRMERSSSFFSIPSGGCYISYQVDVNETTVSVTLYYNKLYLRV